MTKTTRKQIRQIVTAGSIMFVGLLLLKLLPMKLFGDDITFDASAHITITMFCLYILWFFIDQNKSWRGVFLVFSLVVLMIVSVQRILVDAHNDIGLLGGFLLSCGAIIYSQWNLFRSKFKF